MPSRRRIFSHNIETTMGDHIIQVKKNATQRICFRPCILDSAPKTLLEGATSYRYETTDTTLSDDCQINKIHLYPYGLFKAAA